MPELSRIHWPRHRSRPTQWLRQDHALRQYAKLSCVAYIESATTPQAAATLWRRLNGHRAPKRLQHDLAQVNGIREFFNTDKGYLLIVTRQTSW